jgi:hypothetical protein
MNARRGQVPKDLPPSFIRGSVRFTCAASTATVGLESPLRDSSLFSSPTLTNRSRRRAITEPRDSVPPLRGFGNERWWVASCDTAVGRGRYGSRASHAPGPPLSIRRYPFSSILPHPGAFATAMRAVDFKSTGADFVPPARTRHYQRMRVTIHRPLDECRQVLHHSPDFSRIPHQQRAHYPHGLLAEGERAPIVMGG